MTIEICVALAVLIFTVLAVFAVKTLIALQRTLRKVDLLLDETALKSRHLDGLVRSLSNVGEICEMETDQMKRAYLERKMIQEHHDRTAAPEWAEWLALSLKIGAKLLKRK
ncbi:MAG: hypothetical protein LLG04_01800 [Parachlamydia sp.]|nr:hypothetical protein [Parachlamydia sp.]